MSNLKSYLKKNNIFYSFLQRNRIKLSTSQQRSLESTVLKSVKLNNSYIKLSDNGLLRIVNKRDHISEFTSVYCYSYQGTKKELLTEVVGRSPLERIIFTLGNHSKHFKSISKVGTIISRGLIGRVSDSYKYLATYQYSGHLKFKNVIENEFQEMVDLEYRSHSTSKTSRVSNLPRKAFEQNFRYMIDNDKSKHFFGAYEGDELVGIIGLGIESFGLGHILTIAVAPEHKERRLSLYLYYNAMKFFKMSKVRVYIGISSSEEVLFLAKKMKREVYYNFIEVKNSSLL